jgi:hypothetical protein
MANKLYKTTYFGKNKEGETQFNETKYFSNRERAFEHLFKTTNERFNETLRHYLRPDRINIYTHVIAYEEMDNNEYKYIKSAIYSYSVFEDGHRITQCNEQKLTYIP